MTDTLEKLLDEAEALIGQISDARENADESLRNLGDATAEIDNAIDGIEIEARSLAERIDELRKAAPHAADPIAQATIIAIDNLIALLTDARKYFADGNKLSAIGTLTGFDLHAEDLRAAFHLTKMQQRRAA